MDQVLIQQNAHWDGGVYDNFMDRLLLQELIHHLSLEEIIVLLGVRRCGKTTLFRLLINYLIQHVDPRSILYVNLDDPYFTDLLDDPKNLYKIVENAEKVSGHKIQYLFLDEIQNIKQWEKYVKSVYDSRVFKKICVTGSNSKLMQSDYSTLLSGRYLTYSVFPLSFGEMLNHEKIDDFPSLVQQKTKVLSLLDSSLEYGGFPRCHLESDKNIKRSILISYYETILLKDCVAMNNIRDTYLLSQLSHYLISNGTSRYSYKNLSETFSSNEHTIKNYIQTLEEGFLIREIVNYSPSLKKQVKSNKKSYCVDNGLMSAIAFKFITIEGKLFENMVYNELIKFGTENIFYFYDVKECDFIINLTSAKIAVQVCFKLHLENTAREIKSLEFGMQKTGAKHGVIVTYDDEKRISDSIKAIPFWKLFGLSKDREQLISDMCS